jgi:hypothetical protein
MMKKEQYLINEYPLIVLPTLAKAIGLNEAIILQQVQYWLHISKNIRDEKTWVFRTYKEWEDEFPFWSARTIRRTIKNLECKGLLVSTSKYNQMAIDNTKWYTIDYDSLAKLDTPSGQLGQVQDVAKLAKPITINYTDTTDTDSKPAKKSRKHDPVFDALAEVSRLDPKTAGGFIAKEAKVIREAGYTPDDVKQFAKIWYTREFPGGLRDGKAPSPAAIAKYIGWIRDANNGNDATEPEWSKDTDEVALW